MGGGEAPPPGPRPTVEALRLALGTGLALFNYPDMGGQDGRQWPCSEGPES